MKESNYTTQIISKYFLKVRLDQNKKVILFFFLGLILIASISFFEDKSAKPQNKFNIDTTIPNGYVLIPIELINGNSLSNLMGKTGIVDLFLTENGKKTHLIASKLKIVQATDQTDSFAILVKESSSQKIIQSQGPFFATVQNPSQKSSETFQSGQKKITITYQK